MSEITLGKMLQPKPLKHDDERRPYLRSANVQTGYVDDSDVNEMWFSPREFRRLSLQGGDVVVTEGGDVGRVAQYSGASGVYAIQNSVHRIRTTGKVDQRFLYYWLTFLKSSEIYETLVNRSTIAHLTSDKLGQLGIAVPPLELQRRIALFLDVETQRIDELVQEQIRLMQLLEEQLESIIWTAVTKGTDRSVRLQPSGVAWLGDVPEHWTVARIKTHARIESGHTPNRNRSEFWVDCRIPWVSLNDSRALAQTDYISDTAIMINEAGLAGSSARLLPERVVVFTRDATIGLAAITTQPMAVSQHVIAWVCDEAKVLPEFLLLILYAMQRDLERYTFGATIRTIGLADIRSLTASFPPIEEQHRIVGDVFERRTLVSDQISTAQKLEAVLRERRSALITAAVTGQIDVSTWQPPDDWTGREANLP